MSFKDKLAFFQHLVSEIPQPDEKSKSSTQKPHTTDIYHAKGLHDKNAKYEAENEKKKSEEEDKKKKEEEEKNQKGIIDDIIIEEEEEEIEEKGQTEPIKHELEDKQKINEEKKIKSIDSSILLDPYAFPYLFIDKNTKLTETNLHLSEIPIDYYRNNTQKIDLDVLQFNLTLTKILLSQEDLLKIRTILLIFIFKNIINITPYFPTLLTEDILLENPKTELFCKSEHRYFNSFFYNQLKKYPILMMNVIEVIKEFIQIHSLQFDSIYSLIANIISSNDDLPSPFPYNQLKFIDLNESNMIYENQIMNSFPLILPFQSKYKEYHKENHLNNYYYLYTNRENILDAVWSLDLLKEKNFKLEVLFADEPGVDSNGGISCEFIQLAFTEIMKKETDLFYSHNGYYWFKFHKKMTDDLIKKYRCVGVLLSASILNSITIPFRFPRYFYKKLLKREISDSDLALYDQDLYKTVQFLINNQISSSDDLDFVYSDPFSKYLVDLTNHREITDPKNYQARKITEENKQSYIIKLKEWIFNSSIKKSFSAFEEGFRKVYLNRIFYDWFSLDEVDLIVGGYHSYNWSDLKNNAEYTTPYTEQSQVIKWFWDYFDKLVDDKKKNVLKFITGSSTIPPEGLKDVCIKFNPSDRNLPTAHTCFKSLNLPEYRSFNELKEKCDLAFPYSDGYGLF